MIVSIFKFWLKQQRALWRTCRRNAAIHARWPTLEITEPVSWPHVDIDALEIGDGVHIAPFTEIYVEAHRAESKVTGGLQIGDRTWIGASSNIRAVGGKILIGSDCLIAQHVSLIASNHNIRAGGIYLKTGWEESKTGVTIGNNVWIGCGVTVLPGCHVGNNAVVGAGSIVTKDIPAGTIWAGNPARLIGKVAS
jgi:acetyltransferase-like isoleucine patch superfamily enzyme